MQPNIVPVSIANGCKYLLSVSSGDPCVLNFQQPVTHKYYTVLINYICLKLILTLYV